MRRNAVGILLAAAALAAAGCACPAGTGPSSARWEISRKPYPGDYGDVTLLLDRETGRVWRYGYDQDDWIPVTRPEER